MLKIHKYIDSNYNLNNEVIKNFFYIWILKECKNNPKFEKYYKTFLTIDSSFSNEKVKKILDELYNFISEYDATSYRPNNISLLPEETIKKIVSLEINTY
jgi:hypothetical protein